MSQISPAFQHQISTGCTKKLRKTAFTLTLRQKKYRIALFLRAMLKESNFPSYQYQTLPVNVRKNYVRLPSPFRIWDYVLNFELANPLSCHGVVVTTSGSHTKGPRFDSWWEQIF